MKRGGYLERRTPLSRGATHGEDGRRRFSSFSGPHETMARTRMKRKAPRRVEKRRHMRPYLAFIHAMPCCCELGVTRDGRNVRDSMCTGAIEANHAGKKPGIGLKAPDSTCIPMCHGHHADWTEHRGLFRGWSPDDRREWADAIIAECHRAAVPESLDQAVDFANLGLGAVVDGAWVPACVEVAT